MPATPPIAAVIGPGDCAGASLTVRPEAFAALFGAAAVLLYSLSREPQSTGFAILCGLVRMRGFHPLYGRGNSLTLADI
jgi:hypothetical protein